MPRIVREAESTGRAPRLAESGVVTRRELRGVRSSRSTIASRVGDPEGKTSPEELLAAAHATLLRHLARKRARTAQALRRSACDVHCTITMDEVEGKGHLIVASAISARVVAPGADGAILAQAAKAADEGCPFSALIRASATVTVEATLEGGS